MDVSSRMRIPFPRDLVYRTIRDQLLDLVPYMPSVKAIELQQRTEEGGIIRFVNLWWAGTEIPAVAQRVLKPEMLSWIDRASWDESHFTCDWSMETNALPGVLECAGRNVFKAVGDETDLEVTGTLALHMDKLPVPKLIGGAVRPVIERIVVSAIRPNLTNIGDAVSGYLKAQKPA